jgi:hypothetical protein
MSRVQPSINVDDGDRRTSGAGLSNRAGGRSEKRAVYLERVWSDVLSRPGVDHSEWDSLYEWPPAHVPAGRRFEPVAERALEPVVRGLASRLPGNSAGVLATAQFAGPSGIADLVAVTRAQELLQLGWTSCLWQRGSGTP